MLRKGGLEHTTAVLAGAIWLIDSGLISEFLLQLRYSLKKPH